MAIVQKIEFHVCGFDWTVSVFKLGFRNLFSCTKCFEVRIAILMSSSEVKMAVLMYILKINFRGFLTKNYDFVNKVKLLLVNIFLKS